MTHVNGGICPVLWWHD